MNAASVAGSVRCMIYVSELLTFQMLRILNERQRMVVKGTHGSFEFVSLLEAFQRAKSENERNKKSRQAIWFPALGIELVQIFFKACLIFMRWNFLLNFSTPCT